MEGKDIRLTDLHRILIGEVPVSFLLEVILRASILYLILLLCMRFLGKRMASQLSRLEMVGLVSLAAAIGVPIMAPDRGIIPSIIISVVVVCCQRFIAKRAALDKKFETLSLGQYATLIADGVLDLKTLNDIKVSKDRIFAQLRSEGIKHLGEVKRLYLEANGTFTLIREDHKTAGLSVLPEWDVEFRHIQPVKPHSSSCRNCGFTHSEHNSNIACKYCGRYVWTTSYAS